VGERGNDPKSLCVHNEVSTYQVSLSSRQANPPRFIDQGGAVTDIFTWNGSSCWVK
jgi:hypothetical protein